MQNAEASTLINGYVETLDDTKNAKRQRIQGTPGLRLDATVTPVVGRGNFSQDGRTFTVVGDTLYERTSAGAWTAYAGTIVNDGLLCTFASNGQGGNELAICGGGYLYIFDLALNTLSAAISLPLTNAPGMVDYIDGYFLLTEIGTLRVWYSALEDGTSWDALDFFAPSQTSGNVVGIVVVSDRIWVMQSQTGSVYYDSGDLNNPFVPYPSTVMQDGLQTRFAIAEVAETVIWLSQDDQGHARVMQATTPSPTRISTPAIDYSLAQASTLDDAELYAYEQEGHPFAVLTVPSIEKTWVYDLREKEWHERSSWDTNAGQGKRWRARGICNASGTLIVGDWTTGNLGILDLDTYDEYGSILGFERAAPYLSGENQYLFLDQVELGIEGGLGLTTGQGSAPLITLEISRNFGRTWDPPIVASLGVDGDYTDRAVWYQLGRVRADRLVVRVRVTDPVPRMFGPGLWLRVTPGMGTL